MSIVLILQLTVLILIVIAIVLDKIVSRKTKGIIKYYEETAERLFDENQDLKHLRLQDESNIAALEKKNKELRNFKDRTTNIVYGKRSSEEKVEKIIEVIKSSNSNNF